MTLSFSTTWPKHMKELSGKPNAFQFKILKGLFHVAIIDTEFYGHLLDINNIQMSTYDINDRSLLHQKLHTIRTDAKNRWRAGMAIHPVINNRTKNRFQFAPVFPCVSVQEIEFYWWITEYPELYPIPFDDKKNKRYCDLYVDNRILMDDEVLELAINDGFPSVEAFFDYFNKDFKGKIIHWTHLKY